MKLKSPMLFFLRTCQDLQVSSHVRLRLNGSASISFHALLQEVPPKILGRHDNGNEMSCIPAKFPLLKIVAELIDGKSTKLGFRRKMIKDVAYRL